MTDRDARVNALKSRHAKVFAGLSRPGRGRLERILEAFLEDERVGRTEDAIEGFLHLVGEGMAAGLPLGRLSGRGHGCERDAPRPSGPGVPREAEMLLHLFLPRSMREYAIGDLEEEFRTIVLPKFGPRFARRWYWLQVARSVLQSLRLRLIGLGAVIAFGAIIDRLAG